MPRYSTSSATFVSPETGREHSLGKKGVRESLEVLHWNIPRLVHPPTDYTNCSPAAWTGQPKHTFDHGFEVYGCFEDGSSHSSATDYGLDARESALFYFFERDNSEILIKVLDACGVSGHGWVFVAPVTTLAFNLDVREVATGKTWEYGNPRGGRTAQPRGDTTAFPCDATAASWAARPALGGGPANGGPAGSGRDPVEFVGRWRRQGRRRTAIPAARPLP